MLGKKGFHVSASAAKQGHHGPLVPFFVAEPIPMSPQAMGSSNLAELIDYQEMFKREEINLGDIERLYDAWMQRNIQNTSSFKDRKVLFPYLVITSLQSTCVLWQAYFADD